MACYLKLLAPAAYPIPRIASRMPRNAFLMPVFRLACPVSRFACPYPVSRARYRVSYSRIASRMPGITFRIPVSRFACAVSSIARRILDAVFCKLPAALIPRIPLGAKGIPLPLTLEYRFSSRSLVTFGFYLARRVYSLRHEDAGERMRISESM